VAFTHAGAEDDQYEVTWRLENARDDELQIEESWLPHGQFRADRRVYSLPIPLNARDQLLLTREVLYHPATPGEPVENTFLILQVRSGPSLWRIFARMRVEPRPDGKVEPIVELVTVNPVAASTEQVEGVNGA
jgi:hypothetical protein